MGVTRPALRIKDIAPHLVGRMLPALFSEAPELRKPRFSGDPWAAQPHWAAWHWMHTTECVNDERGCLHGLCRSKSIPMALRICGQPVQSELFEGFTA